MLPIRFQLEGDPAKASRAMARAGRKIMNFRSAWNLLAPELAAGFGETIRSQGAALGERWAPLAKSTQARKKGGALIGTGELFSQVTSASGGVRQLTAKKLVFGPNLKHAFVQHYGVKGRMPARPFVGWTTRMEQSAERIMADHVEAAVKETQRLMEGA